MKRTILLAATLLLPYLGLVTPVKAENSTLNWTGTNGLTTENFISLRSEMLSKQRNSRRGLKPLGFRVPNTSAPGNREPLASRGSCPANAYQVRALIPNTNVGLTVTGYPTFFFYSPQSSASSADFVVLNEAEDEIYSTTVALPKRAGVIGISLPERGAASSLEVGKAYKWYFSLICDPRDRSKDILLTGKVQRIAPSANLSRQVERAAPRDRLAIYAEEGVWFEVIKSLADLRSANPNDATLAQDWASLLQAIGLPGIARYPLLGNVTPENR